MLKKGSQKLTCQVVPFNSHKDTLRAILSLNVSQLSNPACQRGFLFTSILLGLLIAFV